MGRRAFSYVGPGVGSRSDTASPPAPPKLQRRRASISAGQAVFACGLGGALLVELGPIDFLVAVVSGILLVVLIVGGWDVSQRRVARRHFGSAARLCTIATARRTTGPLVFGFFAIRDRSLLWDPRTLPASIDPLEADLDQRVTVHVSHRGLWSSYVWVEEVSGRWTRLMVKTPVSTVVRAIEATGALDASDDHRGAQRRAPTSDGGRTE